jgi:hypothetical protein
LSMMSLREWASPWRTTSRTAAVAAMGSRTDARRFVTLG